jgi:UPF0271 protein
MIPPSLRIDLNADLGEATGAGGAARDEALLDCVTSANIACGCHAGDPATMGRTVRAALARGVALGAHPSWPDRAGFGRRDLDLPADAAYDLVLCQLGALEALARAAGARLRHLKPHGALYNRAARDRPLADAIARAVRDFDPGLVLVGLSGGELLRAGRDAGLPCASEVFADRGYEPDGSLTPRGRPGDLIQDATLAAARVLRMVREGRVASTAGGDLAVQADTVCIHGDRPGAPAFARILRDALTAGGVEVRSL